ncbi:MAG: haloacid dehalogenase [Acidimicrobiales bacterium]
MSGVGPVDDRRRALLLQVDAICDRLTGAHQAREAGLAASRRVIRASGSAIRAVHRGDAVDYDSRMADAEAALREAQRALTPYPSVFHAGFLHDAEKEYAEARLCAALVSAAASAQLPGPAEIGVDDAAWLRGLAEAASELRRHLLDRLREGELERGEILLRAMDDVYDALVVVDFPDALTSGLRRTVDALRAVLERTRGDVTTTVIQERLRGRLEAGGGGPA